MPLVQTRGGRLNLKKNRIIPKTQDVPTVNQTNQATPSNQANPANSIRYQNPQSQEIAKTIQQVRGGSTTASAQADRMVSDGVQANRKLQKFIKFKI